MQNLIKFCVIIILTYRFKTNYIHGAAIDATDLNHFENQLRRTIRQTSVAECVPPTITNGNIKILKQKSSSKKNFLSVNITCEYNYVLQPPSDYIMSCFNGFWDTDDVPKCEKCVQRPETPFTNETIDSQSFCPEPENENNIFKDCGYRIDKTHQPFVVNGTLSTFAEFPWHVGIYKKDQNDILPAYYCGGSIITKKNILTVAHCLSDAYGNTIMSREYYVAAGKYHKNYNTDHETTQRRKIIRTKLHPRYKGEFTNHAWDIAVVIIDEPFEISILVHPVCIDWMTHFENEHLHANKYGEVAGWGKSELNLNIASPELRVLKVPYIKAEQCNKLVPNTFIRYITPDKFCAGYTNGSSVCDGDSGGGLVFEKQEKGKPKYYIRGLVSVGLQENGRCDNYKYSTYTKVSDYIPFIRECIENKNISTTLTSIPTTTISLIASIDNSTETSVSCTTPNKEQANCISIYDCKNFVDALKSSPMPDVIKFMRESVCGKQDEKKVCCGSSTNYLSIIHSNPIVTEQIQHENLNLLPTQEDCGRSTSVLQNKSNRGPYAELSEFPWMALLEFGSHRIRAQFPCGGFLINERYVMTSAYCAFGTRAAGSGQVFRVRLGENHIHTDVDCVFETGGTGLLPNGKNCTDPPLNVGIEKVIVHPLHNSKEKNNDIALIRLRQKIPYSDFVKPICLPLHGEKSLAGKQIITASWDANQFGRDSRLLKSFITVVADEECAKIYRRISKFGTSQMCTIDKNALDTCIGDTGGPLMSTLTNLSDIYYAEGVLSFGACGFPTMATRVSSFMSWILSNLEP